MASGFLGRMKLRRKLALMVLSPLIAVSLFFAWFLPRQLEASTNKWATRRAVGIAQVMARAVQAGVVFDDADSVARYLEWLSATAEVVSASVARSNGSTLAEWKRDGIDRFKVGPLTVPRDPMEVRVEDFGNALRVTAAVVSAGTQGKQPEILGCVSAVVSLEELMREKVDQRAVVLVVCGLIMALGTLLGGWLGGRVAKPIGGLTSVTFAVVSSGDLTQDIKVESADETGALAGSFSQMMQRLRAMVLRLKETEASLGSVSARLASTARNVASGAEVVQHKSGETALLIERNDAMLREGEASVLTLRRNAGNVFSSINNMATANTSVATSMQSLTSSADSSSAAIEEMTAASVQMAQRIKEFDTSLNEVSGAVSEIYTSTTQIEAHAETTARLAETVTENASAGVITVEKTVSGVEEIRRLSETTVGAIKRLSGRLASIDEIVAMIRTVAEQTNLLALNAAIIAAQSGEHGRGFAVVADEIKNLASRTRGSTTDIAELIAAIQQESDQVTVAVRQGLHSAEDGVKLGHETREALTLIVKSAREAMEMTQSIARATVQQSQESQRVTLAVRRITTHIQEISEASTAHAKTSEQVMASTKAMRELGRQVRQATDTQAQSSGRIVESVHQINTLISTLSEGQSQQSDASRQVLRAAQAIAEVASKESASVESLTDAVAALQREASTLSETLGAFRV